MCRIWNSPQTRAPDCAVKAAVRPVHAEQSEASKRCEQIKSGINAELGQLHKTNALLIAAQFASNHECVFDVSDALAVVIERVEQTIATLDLLTLEAAL
jgi:hypothetical protein